MRFLLIICALATSAANAIDPSDQTGQTGQTEQPPTLLDSYSFSRADEQTRLPEFLSEASGLTALSGSMVALHHDNSSLIWTLDVATDELSSAPLQAAAISGDFEGITRVGDSFLMSTSHANILQFQPPFLTPPITHSTRFESYCNFEGLVALTHSDASITLLLPCKYPDFEAAGRAPAEDHLVYVFRHSFTSPSVVLPALEIDVTPVLKAYRLPRLRPSAIAAVGNRLLVLAGKERVLLETTLDGELLAWRRLRWPRHPQAEGLTVTEDGTILIADEGNWLGATVTAYRKK